MSNAPLTTTIPNLEGGFANQIDSEEGFHPDAFTMADDPVNWTFMVYLDADNNLEEYGINDFLEMASVGSDSNVDIVAQFDRRNGYDTRYDNWHTTKRYHITNGMVPDEASALEDLGEQNMGNPHTLVDFVTWAAASYPADKYFLVIWNHGGGWITSTSDDDNNNDAFTLQELRLAFSRIYQNLSRPIDVVGFDECFMGQMSVAYTLRNYAHFLVGSEETEPGYGWPYDLVLANLTADPDVSPDVFSTYVVEKYMESYLGWTSITQSATNITALLEFVPDMNNLASQLLKTYDSYESEIQTSISNSESFFNDRFRDFGHFLNLLDAEISDPTINSLIDLANNSYHDCIMMSGASSDFGKNASGMTVYLRNDSYLFDERYSDLLLSEHTNWDELVRETSASSAPEVWIHDAWIGHTTDANVDGYYDDATIEIDLDSSVVASVEIFAYAQVGQEEVFLNRSGFVSVDDRSTGSSVSMHLMTPFDGHYSIRLEVYDEDYDPYLNPCSPTTQLYTIDPELINVPLNARAPFVKIVSPEDGYVNGTIEITVNASHVDGIDSVYLAFEMMGLVDITSTLSGGLYRYSLDTTTYPSPTAILFYAEANATDGSIANTWFPTYNTISTWNANESVLVVDDDDGYSGNGMELQEYYTNALDDIGAQYDTYSVMDHGQLDLNVLNQYNTVIWAVPISWHQTLTDADCDALSAYLQNGGSLFISGRDIGYDLFGSDSGTLSGNTWFYYAYLKARFISDGLFSGENHVYGFDGTIFENEGYSLGGLSSSGTNDAYLSVISASDDANLVLSYDEGNTEGSALIYDDVFKLVYFAFPFDSISQRSIRADVMRKVIHFIQGTVTHAPIFIWSDSDFDSQAAIESWPGDGSFDNPYVLWNLEISSSGYCISIQDTTRYFIIRNGNFSSSGSSAIYLDHVTHATIYSNKMISQERYGLELVDTLQANVTDNEFVLCGLEISGISKEYWFHTIVDNTVNGQPLGYIVNKTSGPQPITGYGQLYLVNCSGMWTTGSTTVCNATDGATMAFCSGCTLSSITATDNKVDGIIMEHCTGCIVSSCQAYNNGQDGIFIYECAGCTISGNTNAGNGWGGVHLYCSSSTTLTANTLTGSGIIVTGNVVSYWQITFTGTTNTVNGKQVGYFWNGVDLAIDGSSYGQVILANCTRVTLNGGTFDNASAGVQMGFCTNCTINHSSASYNSYLGVKVYASDGSTVVGGYYTENGYYGIVSWYSHGCNISDNTILDCGLGIYLYDSWSTTVANNTVRGGDYYCIYSYDAFYSSFLENNISQSGWCGLYLSFSDYSVVKLNNISECSSYGIRCWNSYHCNFSNNNVNNNGHGIAIAYSHWTTLIENQVYDNHLNGLVIQSDFCNIINNTVKQNERHGVYLFDSSNCTIQNNTIANNAQYGLYLESSYNISVFYNIFAWNTHHGYDDTMNSWDDGVDAGNWWTGYSGTGPWEVDGNQSLDHFPFLYDIAPPEIDELLDIAFDEGTSGNVLIWHPWDENPLTYQIYQNTSVIEEGDWLSSSWTFDVNLDHLTVGVYNYTIILTDMNGHQSFDTVIVVVSDGTPPEVDEPDDIYYPEGSTGNLLNWTAIDAHPTTYTVYRDGEFLQSSGWSSGTQISLNVDLLSFGAHNYTIVLWDVGGHMVRDTVWVHVQDVSAPTIDNPDDIVFAEGETGYSITWSPDDPSPPHPATYQIMQNGSTIKSGPWNSTSESITILLDGTLLGVYNYTIIVYDSGGNNVTDEVIVTVIDGTPPTIDSPADVTYEEGDTGNSITWHPTDTHPSTYEILRNGTTVETGDWTGEDISISIDGLNEGVYNFTVVVIDIGENSASDTIFVVVTSPVTTTTTTTTTDTTTATGTTESTITSETPTTGEPTGGGELMDSMLLMIGLGVTGAVALLVVLMIARRRGH